VYARQESQEFRFLIDIGCEFLRVVAEKSATEQRGKPEELALLLE